MPFKDGEINNPNGRPVGSENKLNSQIKRKIISILEKLDDVKLLKAVENAKSGEVLSFLAKIAPKDLNIDVSGSLDIPVAQIVIDGKFINKS